MKSYTCLLLTSNGCGHCTAFRGDGLINNGKAYMKYDYISSLFDSAKNAKLNLLNIHYENMSGQAQYISDISKFTKTKKGIIQERFFKYENKAKVRVIVGRGGKNKEVTLNYVLSGNNKVDWDTFVKEKISDQIKNYIYYFPCFLVIETDEWNKSLQSSAYPMAALPNVGRIIKEDNVIKLDKSSDSLKLNIEIKKLIENISNGTLLIKAEDKDKDKDKEKEKTKTTSSIKQRHKHQNISSKFLIKSYDD